MKYMIEFDLPDNDTVLREIKTANVAWGIWGYSGCTKAKPVQRWIPCKERLPEDEEEVIVSVHYSGDNADDYTASGWYAVAGDFWVVDNEANEYVVAWMPLPDPYKESEEDIQK